MRLTLTRRRFLQATASAALVLPTTGWSSAQLERSSDPWLYGLDILPREAWAGSEASRGPLEPEEVRFLLVHHTASGNQYQADEVTEILRGFFRFHTGPDRGWPDVAYNFLIDRFGRVWEGREGSLQGPVAGSATGGNQGYSQLVAIVGDFTATMPPPEAIDALQRTLAWLADRDNIDTSEDAVTNFISRGSNLWPGGASVETATIAGHRDMSLTECPGDTLYTYITNGLAADVTTLRAAAAATTSTTTKPPTATEASPIRTDTTLAAETTSATGTPFPTAQTQPPAEAVAETTTSHPTSGLSAPIWLTATAVLAGLLGLLRRRIMNTEQLKSAHAPTLDNVLRTAHQPRQCTECNKQIRASEQYCGRCGSPQGANE